MLGRSFDLTRTDYAVYGDAFAARQLTPMAMAVAERAQRRRLERSRRVRARLLYAMVVVLVTVGWVLR